MQLNSLLLRTDFEDRGQKVLSICKENNDTRGHYTEATVTKKAEFRWALPTWIL